MSTGSPSCQTVARSVANRASAVAVCLLSFACRPAGPDPHPPDGRQVGDPGLAADEHVPDGGAAGDPWQGDDPAADGSVPADGSGDHATHHADGSLLGDPTGPDGAGSSGDPGDAVRPNGDPPGGDTSTGIPARCYYQEQPSAPLVELLANDVVCLSPSSVLTLEGSPGASWRILSSDLLGVPLPPVPAAGPGELAPLYLGGGLYTDEGYATVSATELPDEAATLTVSIDSSVWQLDNGCPLPLLAFWLFPDGFGGVATDVPPGSTQCPQPAPWVLAAEVPLAALYEIRIFDYGAGLVSTYDETTMPHDGTGLVDLTPLPSEGRVEVLLLDSAGTVVESAAVYLGCA